MIISGIYNCRAGPGWWMQDINSMRYRHTPESKKSVGTISITGLWRLSRNWRRGTQKLSDQTQQRIRRSSRVRSPKLTWLPVEPGCAFRRILSKDTDLVIEFMMNLLRLNGGFTAITVPGPHRPSFPGWSQFWLKRNGAACWARTEWSLRDRLGTQIPERPPYAVYLTDEVI